MPDLTPGTILEHLPVEDYHAHPALSKSLIDKLLISPAHYQAARTAEHEPTPTMVLGSAVHCLALEPGEFHGRYALAPEGDGRTKAVKEAKARLVTAGLEVLSAADWGACWGMAESIRDHGIANTLLSNGRVEVSYCWLDAATGVQCRSRADYINDAHAEPIIVDIKTTTDASPNGFARSCASFGYHRQAWMYSAGWEAVTGEAPRFVFIAVEKIAPYAVGIYTLDDEALELGRIQCRQAMEVYNHCMTTGNWTAYNPDSITTLELPAWAFRK